MYVTYVSVRTLYGSLKLGAPRLRCVSAGRRHPTLGLERALERPRAAPGFVYRLGAMICAVQRRDSAVHWSVEQKRHYFDWAVVVTL
jgi:hypothetical protein